MRVMIVDDEKPARDRLRHLVEELGDYDVIAEAQNAEQALSLAASRAPDIVLLDIRMPGIGGLEAARHLNAMPSPPAVVFTTAYDEYAIGAFEARAIGYVLKPVRRERLANALEHAARLSGRLLEKLAAEPALMQARKVVCARTAGGLRLIPIDDIRYFRAADKYVSVHHVGGEDLISESLKSLQAEFAKRFVRIHRGTLVALHSIEGIEKRADGSACVALRGPGADEELVVSRRHLPGLRRRLRGD